MILFIGTKLQAKLRNVVMFRPATAGCGCGGGGGGGGDTTTAGAACTTGATC